MATRRSSRSAALVALDPVTGEIRSAELTPYTFGTFFAASSTRMRRLLSKRSGLSNIDKLVALWYATGTNENEPIRASIEMVAAELGLARSTASRSVNILAKHAILLAVETVGRSTFYRISPHLAYRGGGEAQREAARAVRLPTLPGLEESS